jgi:DNA-binding GntR family transcriptional regulator
MEATRSCMSDRIRRTLTERILNGELAPGARLLEKELAKEFDTSQTPVREALRELETMRLVDSEPYRGTRVRSVSDQEMAEAYAVRAVLEQMAAELAAVQLKGNAAKLRKALAEIHAAARAGDQDRYAAANLKLHRGIMEASGNAVLVQVWDSLGFETRIRVMVARHAKDMIELAARHDPMIDALEKGDAKLAGQLLRNHSEQFVEENLAYAKNQAMEATNN